MIKKIVLSFVLVGILFLASCTAAKTGFVEAPSAPGPFGKYTPEIEVTAARILTSWMKFDTGEDVNNNWWMRAFKEQLGIKINWLWTAPNWGDPYEQKINTSLASNSLPSVMKVYGSIFRRLYVADQLIDLTPLVEKYGSPKLKAMLDADNGLLRKAGTVDGKLLAICDPLDFDPAVGLVYIRKDWLDKLGLPVPQTFADIEKVALAFVKNDPDGNGKADTYGIRFTKSIDVAALYNAFGAHASKLYLDNGTVKDWRLQDETKAALAKMQEWYKQGIIPKDFTTKDTNSEAVQDLINSKFGIIFSLDMGELGSPQQKDLHKANPKANWIFLVVPSATGKPVQFMRNTSSGNYNIVTKNSAHPDAAIKMFNLIAEVQDATNPPAFVTDAQYQNTNQGSLSFFMTPIWFETNPAKIMERRVIDLIKTNAQPGQREFKVKAMYDRAIAGKNGDPNYWGDAQILIPNGSIDYAYQYIQAHPEAILNSPMSWAGTSADADYGSALNSQFIEIQTKIITGGDINTLWQQWLEYWKNNGGSEVDKANNEEYQKAIKK